MYIPGVLLGVQEIYTLLHIKCMILLTITIVHIDGLCLSVICQELVLFLIVILTVASTVIVLFLSFSFLFSFLTIILHFVIFFHVIFLLPLLVMNTTIITNVIITVIIITVILIIVLIMTTTSRTIEAKDERIAVLEREIAEDKHIHALKAGGARCRVLES